MKRTPMTQTRRYSSPCKRSRANFHEKIRQARRRGSGNWRTAELLRLLAEGETCHLRAAIFSSRYRMSSRMEEHSLVTVSWPTALHSCAFPSPLAI